MATYMYSSERLTPPRKNGRGQPAWKLALLYPPQGMWTEEEYLDLEIKSENYMIELVDGFLEFLPMPDPFHQGIVGFLYRKLYPFVTERGLGNVFLAPMPVRLWELQMREPDIVYLKPGRLKDPHKPPRGADLVMEIVSPGSENRKRDLEEKRRAYAKAKISEYWIIDPEKATIIVLTLSGGRYKEHGKFKSGDEATSAFLRGFAVDVSEVFAAGESAG
ncbi:MAG: Uma2 family endonuclease [Planctomycetes bacterium]|nr:Uma2 family endonuclease [Planctomycetota bacterium]